MKMNAVGQHCDVQYVRNEMMLGVRATREVAGGRERTSVASWVGLLPVEKLRIKGNSGIRDVNFYNIVCCAYFLKTEL
jgi:hypothetical protein